MRKFSHLGRVVAVEAVVEPGDKRAYSKESNTAVVKLDEELSYELVLVAVDCVVGEGETHADNGPSKECHKYSLIIQIYQGVFSPWSKTF